MEQIDKTCAILGPSLFPVEHANMLALLDVVDAELTMAADNQLPDYELALAVIHYLTEYIDCFHHPREDAAFALAARGEAGLLHLAEQAGEQHQHILGSGATLRTLLEQAFMDNPTSRQLVLDKGQEYTSELRDHMAFEERSLFPFLARTLSEKQWSELEAQYRARNDPLFGSVVDPEYRRLLARLPGR